MTDNAARRSKVAATTNEQTNITTKPTKVKVNNMVNTKTNTYSFPSEINVLQLSSTSFIETLVTELQKREAYATGVGYGAYWAMHRQANKEAFAFKGVAHYMMAASENADDVRTSLARYEKVADHLEAIFGQFDEHIGYLNAWLHKVQAQQPKYNRNGKVREEFKPLALEPFTRRVLEDGVEIVTIPDMELLDDHGIDPDDTDNLAAYESMKQTEEYKRFMEQVELKHHKSNVKQAMDSKPKYIVEPITRTEWLEEIANRSHDEIIEDARMGAWAMAKVVARKYVKLPAIRELIKGSTLEDVDWVTAKGGKAMSLAVKVKSRLISSHNFLDAMLERKEYLTNARLRKEQEDMGTIGESSLPVSGADHDERMEELEGYIDSTIKEIEALEPIVDELYTILRKFDTTVQYMPEPRVIEREKDLDEPLEIPLPDYRTAFQKDPAGYADVPENIEITPFDVDVERQGQTLKRTIWLVTAFGDFDTMRDIAEKCRKVRYEMTKEDQAADLAKMGEEASTESTISIEEMTSMLDSLI